MLISSPADIASYLSRIPRGETRTIDRLRNELARGRDPDHPWEVDWLYRGIEPNGRLD